MAELNEELLDKVSGGNGNNTNKPKIGSDCIGCGNCEAECPVQAIIENHGFYTINPDICNNCGKCIEGCPTQTITY